MLRGGQFSNEVTAPNLGKWIPKYYDVANYFGRDTNDAFTSSLSTFDISNYIDDYVEGAQYEICLRAASYATGSTSCSYYSDVVANATVAALYTSSDSRHSKHQSILPVEKYIYFRINSGSVTTSYLEFMGYRRVY